MKKTVSRWILSCLLAVTLGACGGGAGGDASQTDGTGSPSSGGGTTPPPTDPTPGNGGGNPVPTYWTVRLSWNATSDPLLAGYRVYHGRTSAADEDTLDVGLTASADYQTSNSGTHYFAIAAVSTDGTVSPRSEVVSVVVQ